MSALQALFAGPWGPLIIFGLRIIDVSLGMVRMLLAVRGARLFVPVIALVEIMIWVVAIGNAIRNLQNPLHILGYAAGFAAGNVVGMWLEKKLAYGFSSVRVVSRGDGEAIASALRESGFGVTGFSGHGRDGAVELLLTVLPRRAIPRLLAIVHRLDPDAFVTVEEAQMIRYGWLYPLRRK